jgi:hypothetical protein
MGRENGVWVVLGDGQGECLSGVTGVREVYLPSYCPYRPL